MTLLPGDTPKILILCVSPKKDYDVSVCLSIFNFMLHQIVDAELHLTYFGGKEYIYLRPPTTYDSLRYDGLRRVDIVASTRSPEQTVPPILTTIRIPAPDWAQPPIGLYPKLLRCENQRTTREPKAEFAYLNFDTGSDSQNLKQKESSLSSRVLTSQF